MNVERSVQVAAERKALLEVLNTLDSLKKYSLHIYIYINIKVIPLSDFLKQKFD